MPEFLGALAVPAESRALLDEKGWPAPLTRIGLCSQTQRRPQQVGVIDLSLAGT
jgi:hypothetical protein